MPRLTAQEKSIADYFSNNTYYVPIYQRDFSWTETQINYLLDDLLEFTTGANGVGSDYLLGQIVVAPGDGPNGEQWQLIDGQQRSTSLLLLLTALYHRMQEVPDHELTDNIRFKREHLGGLLRFPGRNGVPKARVSVAKGGENIIAKLIAGEDAGEPAGKTQSNLIDAYSVIQRTLKRELLTTQEVEHFFDTVTSHVWLVRLELANADLALEVFGKMNSRGLDLDNADLLKNRIFQRVSDEYYEEASDYWQQTSNTLFESKKKKLKTIDFLLRSILISETGLPMTNSAVLEGWIGRLTTDATAKEFAEMLPNRAQELVFVSEEKSTKGDVIGELAGTTHFGFLQHLPLLLAARKLTENDGIDHFCRLARMVEDRAIASLLARERTGDFERMVPNWAKSILDTGNNIDLIIERSQAIKEQVIELLNRARAQLFSLNYMNSGDSKRMRYIIARASRRVELDAREIGVPELGTFLKTTRKIRNQVITGFDLEHIWPKSKIIDFPEANQIGNLILLHPSDNRSAGDDLPHEKALVYKTSNLLLNRGLVSSTDIDLNPRQKPIFSKVREQAPVNLHEWGAEAAEQRAKLYWELLTRDILKSFEM